MRRGLPYPAAAFAMGIPWFVALLPVGRGLPLDGPGRVPNLIAMCLASLTVAVYFRPFIVSGSRTSFHVLALGLPSVGGIAFGCYVVLHAWCSARIAPAPGFRPSSIIGLPLEFLGWLADGSGSRLDRQILSLPLICALAGPLAFCITVPMGDFSQWTMRRIGSA